MQVNRVKAELRLADRRWSLSSSPSTVWKCRRDGSVLINRAKGADPVSITCDPVPQSTAAHYGALLGGLNDALKMHGVYGREVRVIRLRLRFNEYTASTYMPPELEIRGADCRLRATVTIVRGHCELAYCVRPMGDDLHFVFPVNEGAEALAFLVGRARDWQTAL